MRTMILVWIGVVFLGVMVCNQKSKGSGGPGGGGDARTAAPRS